MPFLRIPVMCLYFSGPVLYLLLLQVFPPKAARNYASSPINREFDDHTIVDSVLFNAAPDSSPRHASEIGYETELKKRPIFRFGCDSICAIQVLRCSISPSNKSLDVCFPSFAAMNNADDCVRGYPATKRDRDRYIQTLNIIHQKNSKSRGNGLKCAGNGQRLRLAHTHGFVLAMIG